MPAFRQFSSRFLGRILAPYDYENNIFPYENQRSSIEEIRCPVIYFVNDCAGLLKVVKKCGADVIV